MFRRVSLLLALMCAMFLTTNLVAQDKKEPQKARISLYRVAPGKHVDFLKWLAARDAIDREAGVPPTVMYAHTDGDSWDYIGIAPMTTPEQDKKVDELMAKAGLKTGFAGGIEFRTLMASHTDTFAIGPVSASDLLGMMK